MWRIPASLCYKRSITHCPAYNPIEILQKLDDGRIVFQTCSSSSLLGKLMVNKAFSSCIFSRQDKKKKRYLHTCMYQIRIIPLLIVFPTHCTSKTKINPSQFNLYLRYSHVTDFHTSHSSTILIL